MKDTEDFNWFEKLFPPKQLVAISKPASYELVRYHHNGKLVKGSEENVTIRLYVRGKKRSATISKNGQEFDWPEVEFWVETGKWPSTTDADKFEWLMSERKLAQHLLKYLIAN